MGEEVPVGANSSVSRGKLALRHCAPWFLPGHFHHEFSGHRDWPV